MESSPCADSLVHPDLSDPEARKFAKEIIEAQKREIAQMEKILYQLEQEE